ncbi:MAG: zf-HC2 domain-containing protein [Clostridia bacterium]|nr:zf-HC2 domain-containing protein [Clostridia bacterium]
MRLPCAVTRDLLPLYAEDMVEPETRELIDQHLADCPACRQKLSELDTVTGAPVETVQPLRSLKRQIRKRRWYAAAIAALCVFAAVFTYFCHENQMLPVLWEEGLIEIRGIETRPYGEVFEGDAASSESGDAAVEVLILQADDRINGTHEAVFRDEDGSTTVLLQGWTSRGGGSVAREYHEMVFCPVPDRLIYEAGGEQRLLWGEALNGGVEILPRLALGYYVIIAAALLPVSGLSWLLLRRSRRSWIARQAFFAPLAYLTAHMLIKGNRSASFFMERDLVSILLLTAALYALFTLAWQVFLQQKKEKQL